MSSVGGLLGKTSQDALGWDELQGADMSKRSSFLLQTGVVAAVFGVIGGSGGLIAGCGGISPGDYVIYRVSYGEMKESSGCYGGEIPPNEKSDTTSYRNSGTFILYAAANDAYYL